MTKIWENAPKTTKTFLEGFALCFASRIWILTDFWLISVGNMIHEQGDFGSVAGG